MPRERVPIENKNMIMDKTKADTIGHPEFSSLYS